VIGLLVAGDEEEDDAVAVVGGMMILAPKAWMPISLYKRFVALMLAYPSSARELQTPAPASCRHNRPFAEERP
jgi:hypothetical protein